MKKQVLLILILLVGVSIIGEGKAYATGTTEETAIYFENAYTFESEARENVIPEIRAKSKIVGQSRMLPKTGEQRKNNQVFSLGIILLWLATSYIGLKTSERIFYKKNRNRRGVSIHEIK